MIEDLIQNVTDMINNGLAVFSTVIFWAQLVALGVVIALAFIIAPLVKRLLKRLQGSILRFPLLDELPFLTEIVPVLLPVARPFTIWALILAAADILESSAET